jgi:hypothetical protein
LTPPTFQPQALYAERMDYRISVLERAFQLASSGEYSSVQEIKKRLKEEGRPCALQDAPSTGRTERLIFYAFDIFYLDGYDLRRSSRASPR